MVSGVYGVPVREGTRVSDELAAFIFQGQRVFSNIINVL